jgi:hypothetical protein
MQDLVHQDFGVCVCCGKRLQIREILVGYLPIVQFGCFGGSYAPACPHAQDLNQCENHCQKKTCLLHQKVQDLDGKQRAQSQELMLVIEKIHKKKRELFVHLTTDIVIMKYLLALLKASHFDMRLEECGVHSLLHIF